MRGGGDFPRLLETLALSLLSAVVSWAGLLSAVYKTSEHVQVNLFPIHYPPLNVDVDNGILKLKRFELILPPLLDPPSTQGAVFALRPSVGRSVAAPTPDTVSLDRAEYLLSSLWSVHGELLGVPQTPSLAGSSLSVCRSHLLTEGQEAQLSTLETHGQSGPNDLATTVPRHSLGLLWPSKTLVLFRPQCFVSWAIWKEEPWRNCLHQVGSWGIS